MDLALKSFFLFLAFLVLAYVEYHQATSELKGKNLFLSAASSRWLKHAGLVFFSCALHFILVPFTLYSFAEFLQPLQVGLLNSKALPRIVEIPLSFLVLDLFLYVQHRMSHRLSFFWLFHRIHHGDRDLDATTGFRFHPMEFLFLTLFKMLAIVLFGCSPIAVLLFEIISFSSSMFTHSRIQLSETVNARLLNWLVTPSMHRLHHMRSDGIHVKNFSAVFSFWDRLFKSYLAPINVTKPYVLGLNDVSRKEAGRFSWMLFSPFYRIKIQTRPMNEDSGSRSHL